MVGLVRVAGVGLLLASCAGSRSDRGDGWLPPNDGVPVGDQLISDEPVGDQAGNPDQEVVQDYFFPLTESGPLCPNGTCNAAAGENCTTCAKDCPCASDKYCESGTCKACIVHKSSGCTADAQCCQANDICKANTCCRPLGSPCVGPADCCAANATCSNAGNCCMPVGTACWNPQDCCGGHTCTNGTCV